MSEFRVWSRRLSKPEINQRKDRLLKGNEPGLVAYWPLNNIDGLSAPASRPGGHGAALVGGVEMRAVPAIARFMIPGEVEKEAKVHLPGGCKSVRCRGFRDGCGGVPGVATPT